MENSRENVSGIIDSVLEYVLKCNPEISVKNKEDLIYGKTYLEEEIIEKIKSML